LPANLITVNTPPGTPPTGQTPANYTDSEVAQVLTTAVLFYNLFETYKAETGNLAVAEAAYSIGGDVGYWFQSVDRQVAKIEKLFALNYKWNDAAALSEILPLFGQWSAANATGVLNTAITGNTVLAVFLTALNPIFAQFGYVIAL
jgi:hypothetical protein